MNEIVKEIVKLLGGTGRLKAMIGAKNFVYSNTKNALWYDFKLCRKANNFYIEYDAALDLYNIKFRKAVYYKCPITGIRVLENYKTVNEVTGLYAEDVKPLFERYTGLYLNL